MANQNDNKGEAVRVSALIELAKRGRQEVLPALRELLAERPELWQNYGNIARQAQSQWLALIGGNDLFLQESLGRHAAAMRDELAGPDASPLEQLQVERIVALNMQLSYYEALLPKHEATDMTRVVDYLHERCSAVDRRLQHAMMNLARIRKLLPRVLHVDVVVSGEINATINEVGGDQNTKQTADNPARIRVPENRIKDLLAAASN